MSGFRASLREHVTKLMTAGKTIVVSEVAEEFIDANPEIVQREIKHLVQRAVAQHLKDLCAVDDHGGGQTSLLDGLPVGIVIADGVVKPRAACNWDELMAGRRERLENIDNARDRLRRYDEALTRLRPYMLNDPRMQVAQVVERIGQESA